MGRKPPCAFFPQGRCRNGDECRFPHIGSEGGPTSPRGAGPGPGVGGFGGGGSFGRHAGHGGHGSGGAGPNGAARRPQIGSIDERFGEMSLVRFFSSF
jgi:hypothetical protein